MTKIEKLKKTFYKVSRGKQGCLCESWEDALETIQEDIEAEDELGEDGFSKPITYTVEKVRMTQEEYDKTPEFDGFE